MTTQPAWDTVDNYTADLLQLVAEDPHPSSEHEWTEFTRCLRHAADLDGVISPNRLRPLVRGVIAPRRIGAFTNRAVRSGLVAYTGRYEISDDTEGRNSGRPCRELRLVQS